MSDNVIKEEEAESSSVDVSLIECSIKEEPEFETCDGFDGPTNTESSRDPLESN